MSSSTTETRCKNKERESYKFFFLALVIRLFILLIIILTNDYMDEGFLGTTVDYDDYRYEKGAEFYAENAEGLIDIETFTQAYEQYNDRVGYNLSNPFKGTPLWYWIVCFLVYTTKTKWTVRIFNIVLASVTVLYIYKFTNIVYGNKTAKLASFLMAVLPYPAIFSCFAYKDQLVMFCLFYLLYCTAKLRYYHNLQLINYIGIVFVTLALFLTRSGLSMIFVALCLIFVIVKQIRFTRFLNIKTIIVFICGGALIVIGLIAFHSTILYKLNFYMNRHSVSATSTLGFLTINKITDLYKFPLTYMFSTIMPISMFRGIHSWFDIVSNLNIIMTPITIGSVLYWFKHKKDSLVFWGCFFVYSAAAITSMDVFRHYYSLIPFTVIAFAEFTGVSSRYEKGMMLAGASLINIMLLVFYL